jgi:hypothetical protein
MVARTSHRRLAVVLIAMVATANARATVPNAADDSIRQFLAQDDTQRPYRAVRQLEAENGNRKGWLEALTEYSPAAGFQYRISAEGGSEYIRGQVLKAILDGERDVIARGETSRSALSPANYTFQANGVDAEGLAKIAVSPRRSESALLSGTMFLNPTGGDLVRLEGRLAKSPSFWIKNVDIVRIYERIHGVVVPVALETKAQVRFHGNARLRMTYVYTEIDGRPVRSE